MKRIQSIWIAALTSAIGWLLSSCNTYHTVAPLYGVPFPEEDSIGQMICLYGVPPGFWQDSDIVKDTPKEEEKQGNSVFG